MNDGVSWVLRRCTDLGGGGLLINQKTVKYFIIRCSAFLAAGARFNIVNHSSSELKLPNLRLLTN
jgi:hypothetical protein